RSLSPRMEHNLDHHSRCLTRPRRRRPPARSDGLAEPNAEEGPRGSRQAPQRGALPRRIRGAAKRADGCRLLDEKQTEHLCPHGYGPRTGTPIPGPYRAAAADELVESDRQVPVPEGRGAVGKRGGEVG